MRAIGILLFTLLIINSSCTQDSVSENIEITQAEHFIQSPIPQANIPYSDYSFDAAKGDTLFHKSGSILLFPTYSFIDKSGNVIVGKVDIRYREFSNPMDFFLSGIPMNYDSLGTNYTFESSGMCEILAYKDGNPVFVNPENQPEINMVSNNTSKSHSIYYLDTIKQNWENREVSTVTDLRDFTISNEEKTFRRALFEPIKPEKANQKSPIIEIDIDPASFKELMVYDNLKFQLDQNENSFNPKDSKDIWNKVELIRRNKKGLYTVNFINSSRRVSYSARPVLEGEDYSKALLTFERKNAEYKRKLKERITQKEANKKK